MSEPQQKMNLAQRLMAGRGSAVEHLDDRFRAKLCRMVEREMNRRYFCREDPEDVVQSAFRTFYRRHKLGEFRIDTSVDLWRLLETITYHKMLKHVEKHGAEKRTPRREEYVSDNKLKGSDPTPEEAAIAVDLMEQTLEGLDETYVKVFHMRLRKHTENEIAAELDCTRAFVRIRLKRINERLQKLSMA